MSLYQSLLVDSQAKQYLRLTVPRQVLAKTCQSAQVRHSPKAQLHLCRRASKRFQHRQVKMGPRLQVHRRVIHLRQ